MLPFPSKTIWEDETNRKLFWAVIKEAFATLSYLDETEYLEKESKEEE